MPPNPNNDIDIEELTAYLDGELDPAAAQKVEQRLGDDPDFLAEMQSLQKTWDLLDQLPDVQPSSSFTQTTMELVVSEALQSVRRKRNQSWIWVQRLALMLALPVILFAVSFAIIQQLKAQPNRQLIDSLSVIENYPRYQIVENDLGFLNQLNRLGLFSRSQSYESGFQGMLSSEQDVQIVPETEKGRIDYIKSFDLERKSKLEKKRDGFLNLSEPQQKKFDNFDQQLMAHENRDQLVFVMNAYVEWLKTIDSSARSEVLDLSDTNERIKAIYRIREEQARSAFAKTGVTNLPSLEDVNQVFTWYQAVFWNNKDRIRKRFEIAAKRWARDNKFPLTNAAIQRSLKNDHLTDLVGYLMTMDRKFLEDLIIEDQDSLYTLLTNDAREILDRSSEEERKQLVLYWVASANQAKCNFSLDELDEFYEKELTASERNELDKMSTEKYYESLRERYLQKLNLYQAPSFESWESFLEFQDDPFLK